MKIIFWAFSAILFLTYNSAKGQEKLSGEVLKEDVEILWQALNELHPGLYRHSSSASLKANKENLIEHFSLGATEQEVFLNLSEFLSQIKCGHTYVNPFNQRNDIISSVLKQKVLLPFTFSIIERKIVIDQSLDSQLKRGDIITSINGRSTASIIEQMTKYIKADGNRDEKRIYDLQVSGNAKYEYFDYYFPMIYGWVNELDLSINGQLPKKIELIAKDDRSALLNKTTSQEDSNNYDKLWSKEITSDYAFLKLGTFVTWRLSFDWKDYLNDFFDQVEKSKTPALIIDVRGNEGGLTEVTDYLVKRLSSTKGNTVFRKPHLNYKKVSDNLRPHLTTWNRWFYNTSIWTKKLNEDYRTVKFSANRAKKIKPSKKAFKGKTFLLIDEANSSATFILAETVKQNKYATLIGTETGGTKKGITAGQIFFLTLPNSNIEVDIPLIGRYPLEDLSDEGIKPDIIVFQTLEDFKNGVDAPMVKAMDLLKQ